MSLATQAVKNGLIHAIKTTATLMKVVFPVYAVVVVIKYSPVLPFLQEIFRPAMGLFLLPPEAVVPLITGVFTDEYGTIAATNQFAFTSAEITTIAMIGMVFHSIPVEYAVTRKIGLPAGRFVVFRFVAAVLMGILVSRIGGVLL